MHLCVKIKSTHVLCRFFTCGFHEKVQKQGRGQEQTYRKTEYYAVGAQTCGEGQQVGGRYATAI